MYLIMPESAFAGDISHTLNRDVGAKVCKLALGIGGTVGRALAVTALLLVGFSLLFSPFVQIRMASITFISILVAAIALTLSATSIVDMLSGQVALGVDGVIANCADSMLSYYTYAGGGNEYKTPGNPLHGLQHGGSGILNVFTKEQ